MAIATEMTLTLGKTVYGGDPSGEADSDEKIEGRETRVSVTWQLTDAEQNLPQMASVLADQAARAFMSADLTVRRHPQTEEEIEGVQAQSLPPPNGISATGSASSEVQPESETQRERTSSGPGNGNGTSGPSASGPSTSRSYAPGIIKPPITKTQQMAIQSHCTRYGVADWELRKLIWERFGKKEQRDLNKDEAGELLTALQKTMPSNGADHPAYAK